MNSTAVDIAAYMEADSSGESLVGLTFATDLFVGKEPNSPDNCVTIFDTPGYPPQLTFLKGERYEYPSIQIRVRNRGYVAGFAMAESIKELLHGYGQVTINGTFYSLIQCTGGPTLLDWDEKERARFILNFNVQRR